MLTETPPARFHYPRLTDEKSEAPNRQHYLPKVTELACSTLTQTSDFTLSPFYYFHWPDLEVPDIDFYFYS